MTGREHSPAGAAGSAVAPGAFRAVHRAARETRARATRRRARRLAGVAGVVAVVGAVVGAALGAPPTPALRPAPRPRWIGYLANEPTPETSATLRARLAERGWVEARSVKIWYRYAQGKVQLFPSHADELVRLGVDVIVAATPPAIDAARRATRTIPIVMATTDDPIAVGLVTSLEHPGGNLTGVTLAVPGLARRRVKLLRELAPHAARVAILWNPTNRSNAAELRETEAAARALRLDPVPVPLAADTERRLALGAVRSAGVGGLIVLADVLTIARRAELATFAARTRIPAVYPSAEFVEAGGLAAYGPSWSDAFGRVAAAVDRILRGAAPGDLPIERPSRVELRLSLRAARALELAIPPALLSRAQRVVE